MKLSERRRRPDCCSRLDRIDDDAPFFFALAVQRSARGQIVAHTRWVENSAARSAYPFFPAGLASRHRCYFIPDSRHAASLLKRAR